MHCVVVAVFATLWLLFFFLMRVVALPPVRFLLLQPLIVVCAGCGRVQVKTANEFQKVVTLSEDGAAEVAAALTTLAHQ